MLKYLLARLFRQAERKRTGSIFRTGAGKNSRIKPGEKQPEPEEEKKTGVKR